MTITLSPEQEQAVRDAIRAGKLASVEEFIERALTRNRTLLFRLTQDEYDC